MANRTLKGYELAEKIRQSFKSAHKAVDVEICSLLCRAAVSYLHVQEGHCNGCGAMSNPYMDIKTASKLQERFEKRLEVKEAGLERRISALAAQLPGVKKVHFGGDPRGATVKLVMKNGRYDDWGAEGLCVPGS